MGRMTRSGHRLVTKSDDHDAMITHRSSSKLSDRGQKYYIDIHSHGDILDQPSSSPYPFCNFANHCPGHIPFPAPHRSSLESLYPMSTDYDNTASLQAEYVDNVTGWLLSSNTTATSETGEISPALHTDHASSFPQLSYDRCIIDSC